MTLPHHVERLLTPDEVAEILGVPKATLYRWRNHGEGPESMRIGRHLRYRASAVEAFISQREIDGLARRGYA